MTVFQNVAILLAGLAAAYGAMVAVVGLVKIVRNRDRWYRDRSADFSDRRHRVERELERGRDAKRP
jgi:hypothetical protein